VGAIERTQYRIDQMRCPAIQGLDEDTVRLLHKSLVHIVRMRRSIERIRLQLLRSSEAAIDCEILLRRLRREGF
jgi:hypothetical protein